MSLKPTFALIVATLPAYALPAHAGASLFVDDATITPAGRCQIESWARTYTPRQEFTAVPACHWAGTEFALGVTQYTHPSHGPVANLGLKRLFRDVDQHAWGVGASLGASWDGARDHLDGWTVNLPASIALTADRRVVMHVNLGRSAVRGAPDAFTGGIGVEHALGDAAWLLAEAHGDHWGGRGGQLGLRRSLGASANLDLLVGHQHGTSHGSWLTVGLNVLLPR